jgi:hypothetical protein
VSRVPIGLASADDKMYMLCSDGTLWIYNEWIDDDFVARRKWEKIDIEFNDGFIDSHSDKSWSEKL